MKICLRTEDCFKSVIVIVRLSNVLSVAPNQLYVARVGLSHVLDKWRKSFVKVVGCLSTELLLCDPQNCDRMVMHLLAFLSI